MAKGILIAAMEFSDVAEDEFHDWYDSEHLPERQRVPGFLACQRWIGAEDGKVSVADPNVGREQWFDQGVNDLYRGSGLRLVRQARQ